jgi:NADH:ubiquinone reductase (H+-translocating)
VSHRIIIVGGGFGGLYTALELDRWLKRREDIEVILISRENYFLFTPMLHEVAAADLDVTTIVNPLRKMLRRVSLFIGECEAIDLQAKRVLVSHGENRHQHEIAFDSLVLGMGSVTNFYSLPGLAEHALTMKSLGDAIRLRNRVIDHLEEADFECCASLRRRLLTFVVAGGGFAGIETAAAVHDYAVAALGNYSNLTAEDIRVVVIHSGETILPELDVRLGDYARKKLVARGIEVMTNTRVLGYRNGHVEISGGNAIETETLVWTAGTAPNPLIASLACDLERGRICVNPDMSSSNTPGLWAVGDCALVPDLIKGGYHPPTAQHAIRQGKTCAKNIIAGIQGQKTRLFRFRTLGQLASLGRRKGVASIFGINFSGFLAWWLWRTIYLMKLPRFERKIRVAVDWTFDLFFSRDIVQVPAVNPDRRRERKKTEPFVNETIKSPPHGPHVAAAVGEATNSPMTRQN